MSLHRFFVQNINDNPTLSSTELKHAKQVLRMKVGDKFISFDGKGNIWNCEFEDSYKIKVINHNFVERKTNFTRLVISLLKIDRLEWAIEKCIELGIDEMIFTKTRYSQFDLKIAEKKLPRWKEIAISACKQSERIYIPELKILKFEEVLKLDGEKFVGVTEFDVETDLYCFLGETPRSGKGVIRSIFIGPEGGFEKEELDQILNSNFKAVKLSDNILRSETACIVGSYLVNI